MQRANAASPSGWTLLTNTRQTISMSTQTHSKQTDGWWTKLTSAAESEGDISYANSQVHLSGLSLADCLKGPKKKTKKEMSKQVNGKREMIQGKERRIRDVNNSINQVLFIYELTVGKGEIRYVSMRLWSTKGASSAF